LKGHIEHTGGTHSSQTNRVNWNNKMSVTLLTFTVFLDNSLQHQRYG